MVEEKQPLISPTTSAAAGTTMTSDSSNPGAGAGANHSTTASKGGGGGEAAAASEIPSVYTAPLVAACYNRLLVDQTAEIRQRTIPWEGYQRASLITEDELAQIRLFVNGQERALNESGERFIALFLNLLQKLVRPDTIQNILVLLDDILTEKEDRANLFFDLNKKDPGLPYSPFLKLLRKDDEYIQLKSAKILITLILAANGVGGSGGNSSSSPSSNSSMTISLLDPAELFSWLSSLLKNTNPEIADVGVQYLQSVLAIMSYRTLFYRTPGAMAVLVDIFKKTSTMQMQHQIQMQYQTIYIMWLLSFIPEVVEDMQSKYDIIPNLLEYAKRTAKEKVVRVIVATIKNMIQKASKQNIGPLLGNKALTIVDLLITRNLKDPDTNEDLEFLRDELTKSVANLSTFDEYSSEVLAGRLEWSPVHKSEQFWKQNAARLNEKDYEVLRALSRLISTSTNPTVLAIAAYDIGQYIKYCPAGKKFLQDSGTKTQIMMLMTHEDSDVRYQALSAVQKLMQNAWE